MAKDWSYFDKFTDDEAYLPEIGEGETQATQMVTALTKLIYKWYNDGDVFDNHYGLSGWANDLSSYANWLHKYCVDVFADEMLERIFHISTEGEYEDMLADLAEAIFDKDYLEMKDKLQKRGSIYEQEGPFSFDLEEDDGEEEY